MAEAVSYKVLAVGLEPSSMEFVQSCCRDGVFEAVGDTDAFERGFEKWVDGDYAAIFCGPAIPQLPGIELAQSLTTQLPKSHKFYVTSDVKSFEPVLLAKNGFKRSFCLPADKELLNRTIREEILTAVAKVKALRSVKIFDLGANDKLGFDTHVFLSLNNKFIRFSDSKQPIGQERLERLQKGSLSSLYIDHKDLEQFYTYSASRLQGLVDNSSSATERHEKLQSYVREMFHSIIDASTTADFEKGREMIENCQKIIASFVTKGKNTTWYDQLLVTLGEENDDYNHASRVSTLASLFAIGTSNPHPEDLAMAGLFHDLGMIDVPAGLMDKPENEWTDTERSIYQSHPERSLNQIKKKRISIPESVQKAILQHHERFSGNGFPKGYQGDRICDDAQILSYADQFEYLTRVRPGKKRLNPDEAHGEIARSGSIGPVILAKIGKLILKPN